MGNGAVTRVDEWFSGALRCCADDDYESLRSLWNRSYENCPLDELQWGKLYAAAAGRGSLGCLECLLEVLPLLNAYKNPVEYLWLLVYFLRGAKLPCGAFLCRAACVLCLFSVFLYLKCAEAEAGVRPSSKRFRPAGAMAARAAAAAAQPEALDLVREFYSHVNHSALLSIAQLSCQPLYTLVNRCALLTTAVRSQPF